MSVDLTQTHNPTYILNMREGMKNVQERKMC